MNKPIRKAILDGAQEIALPALVSTLSICIVFVPVFLITGPAKFLFTPLAEAVIFAMIASYLISRTLIPTMSIYLLRDEVSLYQNQGERTITSNGRFRSQRTGKKQEAGEERPCRFADLEIPSGSSRSGSSGFVTDTGTLCAGHWAPPRDSY